VEEAVLEKLDIGKTKLVDIDDAVSRQTDVDVAQQSLWKYD